MGTTRSFLGRKPDGGELRAGAGPLGALELPADPDGPLELKSSSRRWLLLAFLLVFCVIWNGPIWLAIITYIANPTGGFAILIVLPFVLVGFALIAGAAYMVLARFNPKPVLRVERAAMRPGESVRLDWRLDGRVRRLQRLTMVLRLRESASYRQGTTTVTDTEDLLELPLLDEEAAGGVGRNTWTGSVQLSIPAGSMHSFKASNNALTWAVVVKGEVPRWPDVREAFELCVLPGALAGAERDAGGGVPA